MVQITVLGNAKQNPIPMNLPLQLLTLCPWTVHPLEGGWPVCRGSWSMGVGRSNPQTVVHGLGPLDLWCRWVYQNKALALCLRLATILLLQ